MLHCICTLFFFSYLAWPHFGGLSFPHSFVYFSISFFPPAPLIYSCRVFKFTRMQLAKHSNIFSPFIAILKSSGLGGGWLVEKDLVIVSCTHAHTHKSLEKKLPKARVDQNGVKAETLKKMHNGECGLPSCCRATRPGQCSEPVSAAASRPKRTYKVRNLLLQAINMINAPGYMCAGWSFYASTWSSRHQSKTNFTHTLQYKACFVSSVSNHGSRVKDSSWKLTAVTSWGKVNFQECPATTRASFACDRLSRWSWQFRVRVAIMSSCWCDRSDESGNFVFEANVMAWRPTPACDWTTADSSSKHRNVEVRFSLSLPLSSVSEHLTNAGHLPASLRAVARYVHGAELSPF